MVPFVVEARATTVASHIPENPRIADGRQIMGDQRITVILETKTLMTRNLLMEALNSASRGGVALALVPSGHPSLQPNLRSISNTSPIPRVSNSKSSNACLRANSPFGLVTTSTLASRAAQPGRKIVSTAPQKDAGAQEVRTWLLEVLHRRCHPDPERVLAQMDWSGRELHRATYLATRHRFRSEPGGRLIAHDIHDAIKQSRRKMRSQRRKGSKASQPEDMIALMGADKD